MEKESMAHRAGVVSDTHIHIYALRTLCIFYYSQAHVKSLVAVNTAAKSRTGSSLTRSLTRT